MVAKINYQVISLICNLHPIGLDMEVLRSKAFSTGNIVNNVITMYDVRWVLDLQGDHFASYLNV